MKMKKKIKWFIVSLILFSSNLALGNNYKIKEIYELYRKGDYQGAIENLEPLTRSKSIDEKRLAYYWSGICLIKLQKFESANKKFSKILHYEDLPEDYYFEYGKSLYALNELEEAEILFRRSVLNGYQQFASIYYLGHIYEILGKEKSAYNYYKEIVAGYETVPPSMKQSAYFKTGQLIEEKLQEKEGKNVRKKIEDLVIPKYVSGIEIDSSMPRANQMKEKVNKLYKKYWLGAISPYRKVVPHYVKFNQTFLYDSNVIMLPDNSSSGSATDKAAPASKSQLIYRHSRALGGYAMSKTNLRVNWDYYLDRENSDIYENDSFSFAPSLNFTLRNNVLNQPAELLVDLDYSYSMRDYTGQEELSFYGQSVTLSVGEKFGFFKFGKSITKLKLKYFYSYDKTLDSFTYTLFYNQYLTILKGKIMLLTLNMDFASVENSNMDTNTYLLRFDYIQPNFYHQKLVLHSGMGLSFTDTKEQSSTRGVEKNLSPFAKLSYNFNKDLNISGKYAYTNNISKNKDVYDYSKHSVFFELELKH